MIAAEAAERETQRNNANEQFQTAGDILDQKIFTKLFRGVSPSFNDTNMGGGIFRLKQCTDFVLDGSI